MERFVPRNLRIRKLAAAMGLAAIGFAGWGSSMDVVAQPVTSSAAMVSLHPAVRLEKGDKVVGALDFAQPLHVVVTLKLRNEQQLDQYIAQPGFRPLTSAQFHMLYGPTKAQAQVVADYLTKAGFSNVKIAPDNALVEADGRADTAQSAFHTSFVHVKTHDGRDAYANSSDVQIPSNLQDVVHAVLGMQTVHISHLMTRYYDPLAAHAMAQQAAGTGVETEHPPSDFPAIYGASGMPGVTSVDVGSISAGPMTNVLNDLASADPGVTILLRGDTAVGIGGGSNTGDSEWDLDSQTLIAFTGVKQYYFYVANSLEDNDLATDVAQVVSDNLLKAIDYSAGECEVDAYEDGTMAAMDTSLKQAVAQGQTFFVSAGDSGSNECGNGTTGAAYPASSPYVTAVGGTSLYTSPNTTWQSETVWNTLDEPNGGSTGGSPSAVEPLPSWQKAVTGISTQTYRGVPDIAFDGDPNSGVLVTVDGHANQPIGGTSLSAPLAAGMWAHVLQADGVNEGFAAPVIYKVAQSSQVTYSNLFHDVISGNNDGYGATVGWDYTTGWGSLIVNQFASQVAALTYSLPVVSFATLPALQVTTPKPGSTHTPGDFNGNGVSDLLWFNPALSQVGLWAMSATVPTSTYGGGVSRTSLKTYNITPGYFVGAVGDFNGDGYADLAFTSANHDVWIWTNNQQGGWSSTKITSAPYPSQWQLIGAGDITGDGYDDLLWLDPSECKFGYWTMKGITITGYYTINIACGYYPISIGYYTSSNRLSIIWTSPANDLYIWDSTGSSTGGTTGYGFNAYGLTSYLPANSHIMSIGGGYQGQSIGVQLYELSSDGTYDQAQGLLLSRSFNANGNQTGVQATSAWSPSLAIYDRIGSAGYVIAGNGVNNTGVYNIDPSEDNPANGSPDDGSMTISTGGLFNGNADYTGNASQYPALEQTYTYGNYWTYPIGWWVVGALYNNTVAPPWQ